MLLYTYYFNLNTYKGAEQKVVYAPSEERAREIFKEDFGVDAGELLFRTNW